MLCDQPSVIGSGILEIERPRSRADEIRLELLPPEAGRLIAMHQYGTTGIAYGDHITVGIVCLGEDAHVCTGSDLHAGQARW